MSEQLTVVVDDDIPAMPVELAGSSRKQGEYLSNLIRGIYKNEQWATPSDDLDQMRLAMIGVSSKLMQMESRLLERQVTSIAK